jgi:hypothetical protein
MKILGIILTLFCYQTTLANDKEERPIKPERLKPSDLIETIQVCGNQRCEARPIREIIRQIEIERSRGGDIIGNGGGLGEMNFVYALTHLADFIQDAIRNYGLSGEDAQNLLKIAALSRREARKSDKLIFVSASKHPEIFETPYESEVRLAVTGLSAAAPIFVNLDLIYKKNFGMVEIMGLPEMVSILVHELGHQIGIEDHQYLDFLGARVRHLVNRDMSRISRPLGESERFEMLSFNYWTGSIPKIVFSIAGKQRSFDKELNSALKCSNGQRPYTTRLSNQHLSMPREFSGNWIIPFRAWIEMACMSQGKVDVEHQTLVLDLLIDQNDEYRIDIIQFQVRGE